MDQISYQSVLSALYDQVQVGMLPRATSLVDQCMHIVGVERSAPPWTGGPVPNLQFARKEIVGVGSHVEQDAAEFSDRCQDVGPHGQRRETVDPCLVIALHCRKHLLSLLLLESSMVFSIVQKPRGSTGEHEFGERFGAAD
ncbi:hypothetical protein ACFX13_000509 [Malus domestica]